MFVGWFLVGTAFYLILRNPLPNVLGFVITQICLISGLLTAAYSVRRFSKFTYVKRTPKKYYALSLVLVVLCIAIIVLYVYYYT